MRQKTGLSLDICPHCAVETARSSSSHVTRLLAQQEAWPTYTFCVAITALHPLHLVCS